VVVRGSALGADQEEKYASGHEGSQAVPSRPSVALRGCIKVEFNPT
jgi:hypothetical protein